MKGIGAGPRRAEGAQVRSTGLRGQQMPRPIETRGRSLLRGRVSVIRGQRAATDARHEVSGDAATQRIAVVCIRPSPHTGQRDTSTPVRRCSNPATDSGRAVSGGG